jgi:hypothetical protein
MTCPLRAASARKESSSAAPYISPLASPAEIRTLILRALSEVAGMDRKRITGLRQTRINIDCARIFATKKLGSRFLRKRACFYENRSKRLRIASEIRVLQLPSGNCS